MGLATSLGGGIASADRSDSDSSRSEGASGPSSSHHAWSGHKGRSGAHRQGNSDATGSGEASGSGNKPAHHNNTVKAADTTGSDCGDKGNVDKGNVESAPVAPTQRQVRSAQPGTDAAPDFRADIASPLTGVIGGDPFGGFAPVSPLTEVVPTGPAFVPGFLPNPFLTPDLNSLLFNLNAALIQIQQGGFAV